MDQVILDVFLGSESSDPLCKSGNVINQFLFWQGNFRSCGYMHHTVAEAQIVQHVRHVLILRAGEDIDMHTQCSHSGGQFTHIHVHAAGILAAQNGQGAGVVGNHGDIESHRLLPLSVYFHRWYNLSIATVAQLAEQTIRNRPVKGSIPFCGSYYLPYSRRALAAPVFYSCA